MKNLLVAFLTLAFALPTLGMTYKTNYPVGCSDLWSAVKEVLANPDEYTVVASDDAQMNAAYDVKHAVHTNISGAILQRTNHVKLVTKGSECQMQVVSNYSGWEHSDQGDFRKRVEDSLAKIKSAPPSTAASPNQPVKPAEPTK
jgi:hypothetical protein